MEDKTFWDIYLQQEQPSLLLPWDILKALCQAVRTSQLCSLDAKGEKGQVQAVTVLDFGLVQTCLLPRLANHTSFEKPTVLAICVALFLHWTWQIRTRGKNSLGDQVITIPNCPSKG